jgi:hypothetical protein
MLRSRSDTWERKEATIDQSISKPATEKEIRDLEEREELQDSVQGDIRQTSLATEFDMASDTAHQVCLDNE